MKCLGDFGAMAPGKRTKTKFNNSKASVVRKKISTKKKIFPKISKEIHKKILKQSSRKIKSPSSKLVGMSGNYVMGDFI
jgi:hypothetical protein